MIFKMVIERSTIMAHFPKLRNYVQSMYDIGMDRDHLEVKYANLIFDIIISLDVTPKELLIGAQGTNWASVMTISDDFELAMPNADFYRLKDLITLQHQGTEKFGSYIFLKYIFDHIPQKCTKKMINPNVMRRYYPNHFKNIPDAERTVFYRWVDQTSSGRHAHNFDKTQLYFGNKTADYCRNHNITSQWITPEQAEEMNIQHTIIPFPWD